MNPPQNAVPPFGILGINNSNSCHAGNPPSKSRKQGAGATGQLPPILVMNPSARASRHRGEGGEEEQRTKGSGSTKKRAPFAGDRAHTSLDPNKTLPTRPTADGDDDSVFADSSRAPHGEAEARERKRQLQQLLL